VIRHATAADIEALVALGREIAAQSEFQRDVVPDEATMRALAERFAEGDTVTALVAEEAHGLVGVLGLALFPHLVSGALQAAQLCWWVTPAARGTVGPALLTAAEEWARAGGVQALHMAAPTDRYGRLFAHRGYAPDVTTYVRTL
jgi:GNAT superfamily N-acetyltransferase